MEDHETVFGHPPDLDTLEKFLAEYPGRIDRNLAKAHALRGPDIFYELAKHCYYIRRYDYALTFYNQAFDQGLRDSVFLYQAGECFLRHGSSEQYSAFFSKLHEVDPSDQYPGFMLKTIRFYSATVNELISGIRNSQASRKPKLIINIALFGSKYLDLFLNYLLSILIAKNNLPYAASKYNIHFVVATTREDFGCLSNNALFHGLQTHAQVHFVEFPEELLGYAIAYGKARGGQWTIPITFLTNAEQYAAIECARCLDAYTLNLWPDHIVSDSFLFDLLNVEDQYRVVSGMGFRLDYDQDLLGDVNQYRDASGTINISYDKLYGLLYRYLPHANYVDADYYSTFPIYLCWKIAGEGVVVHANHYTPWLIKNNCLKGKIYPSLDPIDGFFLDRNMVDKNDLGIAPERVVVFDLSKNPLISPLDGSPFNTEKVAAWLRPWLTDVHQKYFERSMKYPIVSDHNFVEWGKNIRKARSVVDRIIIQAKRF